MNSNWLKIVMPNVFDLDEVRQKYSYLKIINPVRKHQIDIFEKKERN